MALTNSSIREALAKKGWKPAPNRLHILGIRGAIPSGTTPTSIRPVENVPDEYNDTIALFGTRLELFRASVDPGAWYEAHPLNPQGAAHLINGWWKYRIGWHRGHKALTQAGPVTVWRDRDGDSIFDPGEVKDSGYFGIDVHAGGLGQDVGRWSAGCQVVAGGWTGKPWQTFFGHVEEAAQDVYSYYLTDAALFL